VPQDTSSLAGPARIPLIFERQGGHCGFFLGKKFPGGAEKRGAISI